MNYSRQRGAFPAGRLSLSSKQGTCLGGDSRTRTTAHDHRSQPCSTVCSARHHGEVRKLACVVAVSGRSSFGSADSCTRCSAVQGVRLTMLVVRHHRTRGAAAPPGPVHPSSAVSATTRWTGSLAGQWERLAGALGRSPACAAGLSDAQLPSRSMACCRNGHSAPRCVRVLARCAPVRCEVSPAPSACAVAAAPPVGMQRRRSCVRRAIGRASGRRARVARSPPCLWHRDGVALHGQVVAQCQRPGGLAADGGRREVARGGSRSDALRHDRHILSKVPQEAGPGMPVDRS